MLPDLESQLLAMQKGDLGIVSKSNTFDLVTKADTLSESRLVAFIQEQFPDDMILAEEGSAQVNAEEAGDAFLWILDPIDGTTNFANRLPVWGISIGLMLRSEVVAGIVSAPGLELRFRAAKGAGATCNGEPISVNDKPDIGDGIIATGFPYDRAKRAEPISRTMENILKCAGGIRRLGAASLDFCFLADGRFAGYYEMSLKPWDYAAGSLIAAEAGAVLTDFEGAPLDIFQSAGVVATNGRFHPRLLSEVAPMIEAAAL